MVWKQSYPLFFLIVLIVKRKIKFEEFLSVTCAGSLWITGEPVRFPPPLTIFISEWESHDLVHTACLLELD